MTNLCPFHSSLCSCSSCALYMSPSRFFILFIPFSFAFSHCPCLYFNFLSSLLTSLLFFFFLSPWACFFLHFLTIRHLVSLSPLPSYLSRPSLSFHTCGSFAWHLPTTCCTCSLTHSHFLSLFLVLTRVLSKRSRITFPIWISLMRVTEQVVDGGSWAVETQSTFLDHHKHDA